jgi:NAD-dependent SIR2 family protein deacetylase
MKLNTSIFGKTDIYKRMIKRAASHIKDCDALILTSGAGMSVDSGLPDFSSDRGIINKIIGNNPNLEYRNIINPIYFDENPEKFWYIYGDRYMQYKKATPHKGYALLKEICEKQKQGNYFIQTSNVDGMW